MTATLYDHEGRSLSLLEWAKLTGLDPYDLALRINTQGWPTAIIGLRKRRLRFGGDAVRQVDPTAVARRDATNDSFGAKKNARRRSRRDAAVQESPRPPRMNDGRSPHVEERLSREGPTRALSAKLESSELVAPISRASGRQAHRIQTQATEHKTSTPKPCCIQHEHAGVSDTLRGWSGRLGVTESALRIRLAKGEPYDRALASQRERMRLFVAHGKAQTLLEWAKEYGLKPNTLLWRLRRSMTLEQALTWPRGKQRRELASLRCARLLVLGSVTDSITGWAKRLGVHRNTLAHALKKEGWPEAAMRYRIVQPASEPTD